jgi:hypothetical protein
MKYENNPEIEEKPAYKCVNTKTIRGFLDRLNEDVKQGYYPIWDTFIPPHYTDDPLIVISEYDNPLEGHDPETRAKMSELIMEAEFQAYKANKDLKEIQDKLLLTTDWDKAAEEVGLDKIKNNNQRESYINRKTRKEEDWKEETRRWLAHVKRLERIDVLPGPAPWESEEEKEEIELVGLAGTD